MSAGRACQGGDKHVESASGLGRDAFPGGAHGACRGDQHAYTASNAQTALLDALCREVKSMNEKIGALCSHRSRLGHIEVDVAPISRSVQSVANGTVAVSCLVSSLNEHLDDIKLLVEHNANEIRKVEEWQRSLEFTVHREGT